MTTVLMVENGGTTLCRLEDREKSVGLAGAGLATAHVHNLVHECVDTSARKPSAEVSVMGLLTAYLLPQVLQHTDGKFLAPAKSYKRNDWLDIASGLGLIQLEVYLESRSTTHHLSNLYYEKQLSMLIDNLKRIKSLEN